MVKYYMLSIIADISNFGDILILRFNVWLIKYYMPRIIITIFITAADMLIHGLRSILTFPVNWMPRASVNPDHLHTNLRMHT